MSADADTGSRLVSAIRAGDVGAVERLLGERPALVTDRVQGGRTALHVVTDWPGYLPHAPQIARLLLSAGADANALTTGKGAPETPLHWAASTDDLEVAEVLVDAGADLDVAGGSIGTPLDNAVGYGCWHVARLLVDRGARVGGLWQAAGLGLQSRVEELMGHSPSRQEVDDAFWQACSGGQRRTAAYLLEHGADLGSRPSYAGGSAPEAAAGPDTRRSLLVTWLREQGATDPSA